MSGVSTWRLFAFFDNDEGDSDETRVLAEWQIQDALRWCVTRGYDSIYLRRIEQESTFEKADPVVEWVTHYMEETA